MIDKGTIQGFEGQFAAVLDALDGLRNLPRPDKADVTPGLARWFDEFHKAMAAMPTVDDPIGLTRFAEEVEKEVQGAVNNQPNWKQEPLVGMLESASVRPCKVYCDNTGSGNAGSKTTACTWTYTVKDLYGYTLGTGLTPARARFSVGKYDYAADGTYGTYILDGATLVLLQALDEIQFAGPCS